MPMACLKPFKKTAPSSATSARVMATLHSPKDSGTNGFSATWAVASEADMVIVTMKSVATKPRRTSTKSLPFQKEKSLSSIEIEP